MVRSKGIAKNVDRHVGHRIRDRRAEMGLTLQELAKSLGLSYQQVQKYETGANRVSAGRLYEMAQRLEVEVSSFFDGLEPAVLAKPMEHGGRNRPIIGLARHFADIDDAELRGAITSLIKSLAGKSKRG